MSKDLIKQRALDDLECFINLVQPRRMLGQVHKELISWWTRQEAKSHQLALLPRDHQKSALVAFRVAWEITKNPALRVLYISSTSNLAIKQLKFIKDILTSDQYRKYWPEMVNKQESAREQWTNTEIAVDHPMRKEKNVRDPTIFTAGLTTNIVGLHCDIAVLDDVVVDDSAYTNEGREKVRGQVSYLASIAGTDSRTWAVGTRYHPKDLYNDMLNQVVELRNEMGDTYDSYNLYELFERQVETAGDGSGEYLWPRIKSPFGEWYGFNQDILAKKRAQYHDGTKFRAQYYNDPNDLSTTAISPSMFNYYKRDLLRQEAGRWYFKNSRLNVYAAVDFAYSLSKKADFTAIVVVGVDSVGNYYVLDIDRFKTNLISEYFDRILRLYSKWNFRKLRAEVTAAQEPIVRDLKESYIRPNGLALAIDEYRPTRHQGSKEERIAAILQPKYQNKQMWHYSGGNIAYLEEELVMQNPPHDDIKDCLASVVDVAIAPSYSNMVQQLKMKSVLSEFAHPRFGGIG